MVPRTFTPAENTRVKGGWYCTSDGYDPQDCHGDVPVGCFRTKVEVYIYIHREFAQRS